MNTLFLISQLPYPPDTGAKIRAFNLIKRLALNHNITLATFADEKRERSKIRAMEPFCREIIMVPRNARFKYLALSLNLFSRFPYTLVKHYSKAMERCMKGLVKRNGYDLIHCDSMQVSLNLRSTNTLPKILTEHNIESQILRRCAQNGGGLFKKIYIRLQAEKMADYEFAACKRFDRCIAVSEEDRRCIEEGAGIGGVSIVPNGVDCDYFKPRRSAVRPFSLVFTGSLDWYPNEDALVYFFLNVYPFIKKDIPETSITIVGRNPGKNIFRFAKKDSSITITGAVPDVRPYIARSEVFITPLRIGGGTRLKILEAMAMAKPVLSTSVGAEGLGVESGKNIILADGPKAFAGRATELFKDDSLKREIGERARRLVKQRYDWNILARDLEEVWEDAAVKR